MAKNKIAGLTIEIGGNTGPLNKALGEVNKKSKDLTRELKQVDRMLKLDPKNTELVAQKQKILAESIENTSEKLDKLKTAEKQAQDQFKRGEISEDQYRALQREVIKTEDELKKLTDTAKDLDRNLSKSLENAGKKMQDFGGKVENAGKKLAPLSAAAAGVAAGSIKTFTSFDDAMKQVQATMGGTEKDYEKLSKAAQDMGASTRYSATESAEALNFLALAGYDTDKAIAALPKVLNLAQAGGMDLASASDMVTDSISALGLEASDMDKFIDQMAKTSQKSNTSVSQLGEAVLTVGGTAKVLSGGTTEMNTALGLLADNGVKGAEGGTALRNVILSLTAPTEKAKKAIEDLGVDVLDAEGNMRPLQDIMGDFNSQMSDMSEGEKIEALNKIFNKVDLKSVNALMGTTNERWDTLNGNIENSKGAAQDMAETMESGIGGSFRSLKSAVEGVAIGLGEALAPVIQDLAEWIKGLADWFNGLSDEQKKFAAVVVVVVAGLAPLLIIIGKIISVVGVITAALPALGTAFVALSGPVGIVIAAVAAAIAIGVALWKNWGTVKEKADALWTGIKATFDGIKNSISEKINAAKEIVRKAVDAIKGFFNFEWSLPKIKLPHFSVTWSKEGFWGSVGDFLGLPGKPQIGVNWYKDGGVFENPSIIGVGEAGTEAVIPLNQLSGILADAMSKSGGGVTQVVHSGTVRHEGVNNRGELVAAINQDMAKTVANDDRRIPNRAKIIPIE